jgi:hypothetical protein
MRLFGHVEHKAGDDWMSAHRKTAVSGKRGRGGVEKQGNLVHGR